MGYFAGGSSYGGSYGALYGAGGGGDERLLEGILARLAATEQRSQRIRARLGSTAGGQAAPAPQSQHPGEVVLQQKCGTCHAPGGKGAEGLVLYDENGVLDPGHLDIRAQMVDMVLSGKMPKNGDLTAKELSALLAFLYQKE